MGKGRLVEAGRWAGHKQGNVSARSRAYSRVIRAMLILLTNRVFSGQVLPARKIQFIQKFPDFAENGFA